MKKVIILSVFNLISIVIFSQNTIKGIIKDFDNKETLPGVVIKLDTIKKIAKTDLDGKFSFENIPNGKYTLVYKYPMYELKNDTISLNNQDVSLEVFIEKKVIQGKLIVIKGNDPNKGSTDKRMLLERKNAVTVTDGVSAQSIKKAGDSDVSGAAKRITGVTIQNGKYIYVRGLGDRYTQTTLNGLVIPGLDPDVNAIPLDIFPTSIIDNLNVYKTMSSDLYGDFTGGLVGITTKKFPSKKTTEIGLGLDFNPSMHFNNNFLSYSHSKTDWLGFDNGQRSLPSVDGIKISNMNIPDEVLADPILEKVTKSFNSELGTRNTTSMPNGSFSINHGNKFSKKENLTTGYYTSLSYSNDNIYYDKFETNEFLKNEKSEVNELEKWSSRIGNVGKNNVNWNLLASGSIAFKKNMFDLTLLHLQNGESTSMKRKSQDYINNISILDEDIISYASKRLSTAILTGTHEIGKTSITWGNAFSLSNVYEPDFRETKISITDGDTTLSTGNGAGIDRFWRELDEITNSLKTDVIHSFTDKTKLKVGLTGTYKSRDFSVFAYRHRPKNLNQIEIDPNWFLSENQIWNATTRQGTYTIGNYEPTNNYKANQNTVGGYIQMIHPIKERLNLSYGIRLENFQMYYTGQNNSGSIVLNNQKTLENFNILPSLNLNLKLNEKMNLRLAAGNSVARPSFKEVSIAQIYDPITKRIYNGNIDLKQTKISNFDARYEFYIGDLELFAVSGFYKQFEGHIELVSFATAPNNVKPRNSGNASILGTEIEFKKALAKAEKHKILNRFKLSVNASFVTSRVDLTSVIVDETGQNELELRNKNRRNDQPEIAKYRPMAGQSPYSINGTISYEIPQNETNISLSYNIQGEQLTVISSGRVPDVYTDPFNSLNLNMFRKFGEKQKSKMTITINNILQDRIALLYRSYGSIDEIYSSYNPGIQFSLKYNYTF
jgi:hypothetical protein